ncbi:phytanoyl-CoA dioxygenase [Aureococcus anophagefferens]|uniref:Phytanoyl-CoA dioxygenase n=1 Tax=Aureococcus anophagefferens TaxID=44056 RepID=A0ABR1FTF1_AURAN
MAPMAVVGAQGAEYVESDEMLLRVCSGKSLSLAKVVEAAACDAASGTYTDDQGRLALHHACAHDQVTVEILAATPGDRFAKDISGDAPVDLLCRNPAATAAAHASCLAGRDDRVAADYGSLLHYWALCACATPHLLAAAAARSPADRDARGLTPLHCLCSNRHGPTAVWPGTHGADFHALSDADRLARLRDGRQLAICPLKPGEGILFDARLFHRGGRNATAADRRSLLSVSLQAGGGDAASPAAHAGTTDSIFAAYRDKYRLGDFAAAEA